jgi:hypothetical protein
LAPTAEVEIANTNPFVDQHRDRIPLPTETINPLLPLRNLTRLRLSLHRPVDVDDAFLRTMVTSWPRLQVLELVHTDYSLRATPRLTLLVRLILLALHGTELMTWALSVDATTLPAD